MKSQIPKSLLNILRIKPTQCDKVETQHYHHTSFFTTNTLGRKENPL